MEDRVDSVGPYRIAKILGSGGMGVVYRAVHSVSGAAVALKLVRGGDDAMLAGVRREIHALRRLDDPGVVRIVDSGEHGGLPWYAMELVEGESLRDWLRALWRPARITPTDAGDLRESDSTFVVDVDLPLDGSVARAMDNARSSAASQRASIRPPVANGQLHLVLTLACAVADTLAFVHGSGVVHRDLKPANIWVRADGTPALLDFGIVSRLEDAIGREALDAPLGVSGTVGYMSPEQIRGEHVDARTDLYALGCVLYECIAGRPPFEGGRRDVLDLHLHTQPEPPSLYVEGVTPALDALVLRLLAKKPRDRLGHADDVARALAGLGANRRARARAAAPPLYRPEFGGRDDLISAIRERLDRVTRDHAGGLIVVRGESGLGKTRLAVEAARFATQRGFAVVTGECVALGATHERAIGAPLHPFRGFLRAVASRCRRLGLQETARLLGPRAKLLAAFEPSFASLPGVAALADPPTLAPEDARQRLIGSLTETLLAYAAAFPTLLVLDDLQWADDLSLAVLEALRGEAMQDLVVLVTWRTEETTAALDALAQTQDALVLSLGALDDGTLTAMIGEMLGLTDELPPLLRHFVARAQGSPLLVAECLRVAVFEGLVTRNDAGRWTASAVDDNALAALPLPQNLYGVIVRRLQRLSEPARALAQLSAVAGREADVDMLLPLLEGGELVSLEALRELVSQQILEEPDYAERRGHHRFAHDKVREVAYDIIPERRRIELHREIGLALEQRLADAPPFTVLAHHFAQAGDRERAIGYLELAGDQAIRSYSNRDVVHLFTEASRLDAQSPRRVDAARRAAWERNLGEATLALGELHESRAHLVRANALLGSDTPQGQVALAGGIVWESLVQIAHRWGVARRRGSDSETKVALSAAWACERLAEIGFLENDAATMAYHFLRALNLAERAGPSPELARGFANVCVGAGVAPLPGLSDRYRERAFHAAQALGDPSVRLDVARLASLVQIGRGQFAEADREYSQLLAAYEQMGNARRWTECATVLAHALQFTGASERSNALFDQVQRVALEIGAPMYDAWAKSGQAASLLDGGHLDDAASHLETCRSILVTSRDRMTAVLTHGLLAEVRARQGRIVEALEAVAVTLAMIEESAPASFAALRGYVGVTVAVDIAWASAATHGERTALARLSARACGALARFARRFPIAVPYALLARAARQHLRGRKASAQALLDQARAEALRLGMPHPLEQSGCRLERLGSVRAL